MVRRRDKAYPRLYQKFWTPVGDMFAADPLALKATIEKNMCTEDALKRRMGASFPELAIALTGAAIDK